MSKPCVYCDDRGYFRECLDAGSEAYCTCPAGKRLLENDRDQIRAGELAGHIAALDAVGK